MLFEEGSLTKEDSIELALRGHPAAKKSSTHLPREDLSKTITPRDEDSKEVDTEPFDPSKVPTPRPEEESKGQIDNKSDTQ